MQLSQEFSNQQIVQNQSPKGLIRQGKPPEYPGSGLHLNATASSSATFIDDNRLAQKAGGAQRGVPSRQPLYSEQVNKT